MKSTNEESKIEFTGGSVSELRVMQKRYKHMKNDDQRAGYTLGWADAIEYDQSKTIQWTDEDMESAFITGGLNPDRTAKWFIDNYKIAKSKTHE